MMFTPELVVRDIRDPSSATVLSIKQVGSSEDIKIAVTSHKYFSTIL